MDLLAKFLTGLIAGSIEAKTASDERKKALAAQAEADWQACKADVFNLDKTLDARNEESRRQARLKDAGNLTSDLPPGDFDVSDTKPGK